MVTLSPLLFNFTWEYIIRKVQQNRKGLGYISFWTMLVVNWLGKNML